MKYTVSYSGKIVVDGAAVREIFLSREFDETTPIEDGYASVRNQVESWIDEELSRLEGVPVVRAAPVMGQVQPAKPALTVDEVQKVFPQDLASLLSFTDAGDVFMAVPKQFLGSENFGKVAAVVRNQLGGGYVSAGKNSYFEIPKGVTPKPEVPRAEEPEVPEFDPADLIQHDGWKGRRLDDGSYSKGSPSFGWDWIDKFPESVVVVLSEGPLAVGEYEFTMTDKIVQAKKKTRGEKDG